MWGLLAGRASNRGLALGWRLACRAVDEGEVDDRGDGSEVGGEVEIEN